jgi:AcrR family transcriptional regulator
MWFDTCQHAGNTPAIDATRDRILEAAWSLVREHGARAVTMADVARAAGVSRQLVYFHFDGRAGLFVEMARHHDVRKGFTKKIAATRKRPPVEGLEALLRAWFAYIPLILPVARALEAAAITGEEAGFAWHDRMSELREAFRIAVERIEADNRLAQGWTVGDAADWIWATGHLTTWQHLVEERGWRPREFADRAIRWILDEIATPPAT